MKMKYAIIKCTDGNFNIHQESTNLDSLKAGFFTYCANLWNDPQTTSAKVMIVDEQLNCVDGYMEYVHHEV
jgi:hypothetical protein